MKATMEQVDLLRSRANVGYKEAKEALEMFDGDMVEALAHLEEQNKTKQGRCCHGKGFMNAVSGIIEKGNKTFMKITKNDATLLNLPLTIVVPIALIATPLMAAILVLALLTGCSIRFRSDKGDAYAVNSHLEKVSNIVSSATAKFEQEMSK